MYNKVFLIGHLGKDPELKTTQHGSKYVYFSLATSKKVKDKQVTQWHNIVMWDKLAEIASNYLKKGSKCFLSGELAYYTPKEGEGLKTQITAFELKLLDTAKRDAPNTSTHTSPAAAQPNFTSDDMFASDNIPF